MLLTHLGPSRRRVEGKLPRGRDVWEEYRKLESKQKHIFSTITDVIASREIYWPVDLNNIYLQ